MLYRSARCFSNMYISPAQMGDKPITGNNPVMLANKRHCTEQNHRMLSALYVCPVTSNSINKGPLCQISSDAVKLTEGDNNGAGDTVRHNNSEDTHHPGIRCPKLELIGLVLQRHNNAVFKQTTSTQI